MSDFSGVGLKVREAGEYAERAVLPFTAGDIVDAPDHGTRRRVLHVGLTALVLVLVAGLITGLVVSVPSARRPSGHHSTTVTSVPPSPPAPAVARDLLVVSQGRLELLSPTTGSLLRRIPIEWSGSLFTTAEQVAAVPGAKYAYVEGQEGHGGPIILAVPLGGGPAKLVASYGPGDVAGLVLSPNGQRLAWVQYNSLVIDTLATGHRKSVRLGQLVPGWSPGYPAALAWSPDSQHLALVIPPREHRSALVAVLNPRSLVASFIHLTAPAQGVIGTNTTSAAWLGNHLFVGNWQCIGSMSCPPIPFESRATLSEIDLSSGALARTLRSYESVRALSADPSSGRLAVEEERSRHNGSVVSDVDVLNRTGKLLVRISAAGYAGVGWLAGHAVKTPPASGGAG